MLSLWELQIMTAATSCVGTPPQHRQKDLPGESVGGNKLFPLPSPSGSAGCRNGIFSRLKKLTACSGDSSHFSRQLEELAVLVVTLGAGLHLQRGNRSICMIPK